MPFPSPDTLEITPQAVAALREAGENFTLVDCREQDEWDHGHLEGAELAPLSQFAETARKRFTDAREKVVIYCHHGMRSARASLFLREGGLPNVWSMAGGIEAWSLEIDPEVPRY
jgi:rhodanese-related sulfurtransferase